MKNPALSLSLLESEITRLYILQQSISGFAETLETALPAGSESGWGLDRPLGLVAKALNPDLTGEEVKTCSQLPVLTLAARTAVNTVFGLLAALKLARGAPDVKGSISADVLIKAARKKRTGEYENREDFIRHLPWLVQSALDYLRSEMDDEPDQKSGGAEAVRLLAAILDAMEVHGLEMIVPDDGRKGTAKGKGVKEERGRYTITRDAGINAIVGLPASFH